MSDSDSEFDDDDDDGLMRLLLCAPETRADRTYRVRLVWDEHVQQLEIEKKFERTYRMSHWSFTKLFDLIRHDISINEHMSYVCSAGSTRAIIPEIVLHCFIRYLAGGSYLDVCLCAQMSVPSFYRCKNMCLAAICKCKELAIRFDVNSDSLQCRMALTTFLSKTSDSNIIHRRQ